MTNKQRRDAGQLIKKGDRHFLVRVYYGLVDGKRKYINRTVRGNYKDAQNILNKLLLEKASGKLGPYSQLTTSQFLDKWLKNNAKQRLGPKSLQSYSQVIALYIQPRIGNIPLDNLKAGDIQHLYNELMAKSLSPRTVRYTHAVLNTALNQAVKEQHIGQNPATLVELPKQSKKERLVLTPEQAEIFLDAIRGTRWATLFSLLLYTGMRPGEALGLQWGDVDFKNGRVHIQRALVQDRHGGTWQLTEPKTSHSRRGIPLPTRVLEDLRIHQFKHQGAGKAGSRDLIFLDNTGEPPEMRKIIGRHFKPILKKAGLPDIRLYDLRHTCATLLLMNKEKPKVVAERLGHASITLTLDTYSHVLPDMQQDATAKLEGLLEPKKHSK